MIITTFAPTDVPDHSYGQLASGHIPAETMPVTCPSPGSPAEQSDLGPSATWGCGGNTLTVPGLAPGENPGRGTRIVGPADRLPLEEGGEQQPVDATPGTVNCVPGAAELAERNRRRDILEAVQRFLEANPGAPIVTACGAAGVNLKTYYRWRAAFSAEGEDGLLPRTANCGRKPAFDASMFCQEGRQKLVQLYIRTGSQALALQLFREDPLCPAPLVELIDRLNAGDRSRHSLPPSLRKLLYQTPAIHDKFRGPRRYELNAVSTLRSMTELMPDRQERQIEPGDWWEMDDMSVNFPFWYESPFGTDKLAERHGVGIGRQSLCAMDIASGKWLGFELIGRPRDAYRAEDILRFLRRLFSEYGLPRRGLRLEQGVWKSKRITGYAISETAAAASEETRPGMDEEAKERISGGLQALGIQVQYVFTPKAKGFIESGFNFLQSVMAAISHK